MYLQVEQHGHDQHEVRGDHVEAQHAREGRVQVAEEPAHLLPGRHQHQRQPGLLLHRTQIQVSLISLVNVRMEMSFRNSDRLLISMGGFGLVLYHLQIHIGLTSGGGKIGKEFINEAMFFKVLTFCVKGFLLTLFFTSIRGSRPLVHLPSIFATQAVKVLSINGSKRVISG